MLMKVSKFKSAANATVIKPAGTFTRVSIVREISNSSTLQDADNSDGEDTDIGMGGGAGAGGSGTGTGTGDDNGGYSTSLGSEKGNP